MERAREKERADAARAESHECTICMERPKTRVTNCGHTFCEQCLAKLENCPSGCGKITSRTRLFM